MNPASRWLPELGTAGRVQLLDIAVTNPPGPSSRPPPPRCRPAAATPPLLRRRTASQLSHLDVLPSRPPRPASDLAAAPSSSSRPVLLPYSPIPSRSSTRGTLQEDLAQAQMSTISDQKKWTLEAVQQRYASAKAKKVQDQQPKYQKSKDSTPKPTFDARGKGKTPELTPSRTSTVKAQASSSYQQKPSASSGGEVHPIYSELSFALHENLCQDDQDGFSELDGTDVVHSIVYDIIQKGGEAGRIAKGSKKLKLEKGILLDNYVQRAPILVDAQSQSLLVHSKRSKRHMSLKQHKKCGSFDLHDTFHRFDLYKPMHEMWKEYIRELTKSTAEKKVSEYLLSADLHVAQCKAASYQGVSGIMIRDTAETFGIISEDNHFRVVPKAGSVFVLQAGLWKVTLIGDKLSPKEKLKESQRLQRAQSLIR